MLRDDFRTRTEAPSSVKTGSHRANEHVDFHSLYTVIEKGRHRSELVSDSDLFFFFS
jgi:hypothetical protein